MNGARGANLIVYLSKDMKENLWLDYKLMVRYRVRSLIILSYICTKFLNKDCQQIRNLDPLTVLHSVPSVAGSTYVILIGLRPNQRDFVT